MFGRKKRHKSHAATEGITNTAGGADYARDPNPDNFGGDYARDAHGGGLGDDYARDPLVSTPPHGDPLVPRTEELRSGPMERRGSFRGVGPRGFRRSDDRIREEICDRLCIDERVDATDIDVIVRDGDVMLTGSVPSPEHRRAAMKIADSCAGVRTVEDRINVGRAPNDVRIGKAWE